MSIVTLHNEKKDALIPTLRFKGFQEKIKETKFGKVVQSNIYGPRFNANDYSDVGNVRTIRGTDLGIDGEIKYDQVPLALLDEKMINTHKLLEGDIVMITTAECGATGVYRKQEVDYLSSAYGVRLRLNELGYPYYFKYFFQTRQAKKEINSYIRKSTIANLPGSDILRVKVNLPSFPEQQKIASFLNAVDEKTQQLSRKKELLEQYKKGVMQQLFTYKKRLLKDGKLRKGSLGDFGYFYYGKGAPKTSIFKDAKTPCVRYGELYSTYKEEIKKIKSYTNINPRDLKLSKGGEVLVPRVGEDPNDFANCSYLPFPNVAIGEMISVYNTEEDGLFMTYYINAMLKKQLAELVEGGNVSNLYFRYVETIKIEIPTKEEQYKIVQFLKAIDSKIESTSQQITQTQSFKKGLLQQLFV